MHWLAVLSLLAAPPAPAAERPTVVIVVGAEGAPEYGRHFAKWADRWAEAATRGEAKVAVVGRERTAGEETNAESDKQRLRSLIEIELKQDRQPLWLVLIGHGTHDGQEAKFNLRGPDVSDAELAEWLKPCKRPLAVINCASASAPFLNRLSGDGRVVVTATRSGSEVNFARFGDHLSAAIGDAAADLDKDGQTSLLEAFLAASHRVTEFYKQDGRLATEHALLDDNGDGLGIPADWFKGTRATRSAKDGVPLDGPAAHRWHLLLSPDEQAMGAEARAQRDDLEEQLEALRATKASLDEAAYYAKLNDLMVRLARVYDDAARAKRPTTEPPQSGNPKSRGE